MLRIAPVSLLMTANHDLSLYAVSLGNIALMSVSVRFPMRLNLFDVLVIDNAFSTALYLLSTHSIRNNFLLVYFINRCILVDTSVVT